MERKYYLRGLGLGIAVTAVIMGIALSSDKAMTNDEIIARAKELGMVENTVLSGTGSEDIAQASVDGEKDAKPSVQDKTQGNIAVAVGDEAGGNESEVETEVEAESEKPDWEENEEADFEETEGSGPDEADGDTSEEEQDAVSESEPEAGDNVENPNEHITSGVIRTIVIKSGDSSYTVAKKLEDVGVVTSASTFDTFLCQNGYDKRLRTGTFSIPADASDEQIARIVTGLE